MVERSKNELGHGFLDCESNDRLNREISEDRLLERTTKLATVSSAPGAMTSTDWIGTGTTVSYTRRFFPCCGSTGLTILAGYETSADGCLLRDQSLTIKDDSEIRQDEPTRIPIRNLWHMLLYAWNERSLGLQWDAAAERHHRLIHY